MLYGYPGLFGAEGLGNEVRVGEASSAEVSRARWAAHISPEM